MIDVRRDHAIRSTGVLIVYGVNQDGQREPLDLLIADSESETSWNEIFQSLKKRGLQGVDLVVSDNHTGLVQAIKKNFQGAKWQRCQTHFMRNILGRTPRHLRKELAAHLKLIFRAEDEATARKLARDFIERYQHKAQKAMDCLERGLDHALTILQYPHTYRQRLRTSNVAERMNEEIRRRQRVIRIFPNEDAAQRLIGALLVEMYETWKSGIRYFSMQEYWDWKTEQTCSKKEHNVIAIN